MMKVIVMNDDNTRALLVETYEGNRLLGHDRVEPWRHREFTLCGPTCRLVVREME